MGLKITIISVGKIKEKYLLLGIDEFSKRLKRFCQLELIEVKDEPIPERASQKEMLLIQKTEESRILNKLAANTYVIATDIDGQQMTSDALAAECENLMTYGKNHLTFLIGGSLGLSETMKAKAHLKLSISKMTFPHQLFKLLLLEQIYRAFKINTNEKYHK